MILFFCLDINHNLHNISSAALCVNLKISIPNLVFKFYTFIKKSNSPFLIILRGYLIKRFYIFIKKIERKINTFVKKVQEQSLKLGEKYIFKYNQIRHQYTESECGMYSLYFIIKLLEGASYKSLTNKKIPDKKMRQLRKRYFNCFG